MIMIPVNMMEHLQAMPIVENPVVTVSAAAAGKQNNRQRHTVFKQTVAVLSRTVNLKVACHPVNNDKLPCLIHAPGQRDTARF